MKQSTKKIGIYIAILITFLLIVALMIVYKCSLSEVKIEIYKVYLLEDHNTLIETIKIKEGQLLELSKDERFWNANDMKILKIGEDYVKISRKAIKYDTKHRKWNEEVIEKIPYDELNPIDIDEMDPASSYTAPRYSYYFKFVK